MPSKDEISKKIVDILINDFECDKEMLNEDSNLFADLGLDSIDAVDLVVRLQEITNKKIDPKDFWKIQTLRELVDTVDKLINNDNQTN